jgi:hypothetical protein
MRWRRKERNPFYLAVHRAVDLMLRCEPQATMNLGVGVTVDELLGGDGPHPAPSPKIDESRDD